MVVVVVMGAVRVCLLPSFADVSCCACRGRVGRGLCGGGR